MKRISLSTELKDWVPGVYYNSESLVPKKLSELFVKFYNENFVN